jgi:HSP20 family protein
MYFPQVRTSHPVLATDWADQLLEGFLSETPFRFGAQNTFPAWNVSEDEKGFRVEAEVPGFAPGDLDIRVVGDELHLEGTREHVTKGEESNVHRRERFAGKFSRAIRFGVPIDAEKIEASFKDGVLTVTLPKSEAALPRKIQVKAS